MKKNLRSKILLCVLAGGVLAANTALAATGEGYVCGESFSSGKHEIKIKRYMLSLQEVFNLMQ